MRKLITALVLSISLSAGLSSAAYADCVDGKVGLRGDWGKVDFKIELVDTPKTRAKGLMFRESMPQFSGMLFIFERPQKVAFWMKNTLIPLDMLFVDKDGVVQRVHENAIPGDLTAIPGGRKIYAVLEINGGMARTLGITEGTQLQHAAFATETAAWPCS